MNFRPALIALLPVLFPPLAGCGGPFCDAAVYSSVMVTVVDAQGEPIEGATATFSVDGGASEPCDGEVGEVSLWCGVETEGEFTIVAQADGYESAMGTVTVNGDRCHVMTEELELELAATP